jgi:hypothetical protein
MTTWVSKHYLSRLFSGIIATPKEHPKSSYVDTAGIEGNLPAVIGREDVIIPLKKRNRLWGGLYNHELVE